jgi:hypothetical protein
MISAASRPRYSMVQTAAAVDLFSGALSNSWRRHRVRLLLRQILNHRSLLRPL